MADCFGTLVFTQSPGCVFDAQRLVEVANSYEWDNDLTRWQLREDDGDVYLSVGGDLIYPCGIPLKGVAYHIVCPMRGSLELERSQVAESDWQYVENVETEEASLEEFATRISACLSEGWVEFSAVGNEKRRFIYFESVRVYASGRAVLCQKFGGPVVTQEGRDETFEPPITIGKD
jgi:hypothetical protein